MSILEEKDVQPFINTMDMTSSIPSKYLYKKSSNNYAYRGRNVILKLLSLRPLSGYTYFCAKLIHEIFQSNTPYGRVKLQDSSIIPVEELTVPQVLQFFQPFWKNIFPPIVHHCSLLAKKYVQETDLYLPNQPEHDLHTYYHSLKKKKAFSQKLQTELQTYLTQKEYKNKLKETFSKVVLSELKNTVENMEEQKLIDSQIEKQFSTATFIFLILLFFLNLAYFLKNPIQIDSSDKMF